MVEIASTTICYLLAFILILSVIDKVKNWQQTKVKISAYKILSNNLIKPASIVFIALEIYLSVVFLFMYVKIIDILLFSLLMGIYTMAVIINIYRGNTRISCGCGGMLENDHLTVSLVFRNTTLILFSFVLFLREEGAMNLTNYFFSFLLAWTILFVYGVVTEYRTQVFYIEKLKSRLPFFA